MFYYPNGIKHHFKHARGCPAWIEIILIFGFLLGALALAVVLSGCAHTQQGLDRETALYLATSNTVASARSIAPYLPAPTNQVVEGFLAAGGALLALWATHLQRTVRDIRSQGGQTAGADASPPARPTPAA
jgi:hypothetical protein